MIYTGDLSQVWDGYTGRWRALTPQDFHKFCTAQLDAGEPDAKKSRGMHRLYYDCFFLFFFRSYYGNQATLDSLTN